MVWRDTGLGNSPNQPEEDLQNPDLNIVSGDSDSEPEEVFGEDGLGYYHPIPDYNPTGLISDSEEEVQPDSSLQIQPPSEDLPGSSADANMPDIESIENTLIRNVWAKPPPKEVDIELPNSKIDEVKLAMKNVSLPSTSFPEWAKNIPEDQWKEHLINRLSQKDK